LTVGDYGVSFQPYAILQSHLQGSSIMVKVDMRNSTVGVMNVADTISFGNVQNKFDVISGIDAIRTNLRKAQEDGDISKEKSDFAQAKILEATQEAKSASPDKHRVRSLLTAATEAIKDTVSVATLFEALTKGTGLLLSLL